MDEISTLREKINKIDQKISILLKDRFSVIKTIGKIKKKKGLKISNKKREDEIISKLDNNFEKKIFKKILAESKKAQGDPLTKR